jgi:hypothetical protein
MKKIEKEFKRGADGLYIYYEMIERTETVGLFKLFIKDKRGKEHVGWEVARIYYAPERMIHDHLCLEHEYIVGDENFGRDGSSAFFPHDENIAREYLQEFTKELFNKEITPVE